MSNQAYTPDPSEQLTDLSASRIKTVDACGLRFKLKYVDRIPAKLERASTLFGNVVHDAVDIWYGPEADYQTEDLRDYVHKLWEQYLPPGVWMALDRVLDFDRNLDDIAGVILLGRPDLKSPRTTKAFLESSEFKQFEDARDLMLQRCKEVEETMTWPKDEDPMVAYRRSMVVAKQLQERWRPQPRPLFVEQPFLLEFEGYTLKGRIDQIRRDVNLQTAEILPIELLDLKTGRQIMTQQEAFIQAWIYYEACHRAENLPDPDHVCFWMARHNRGQYGRMDRERHGKLALQILNNTARKIVTGDWAPQYGTQCKLCDYREDCEADIAMWPAGEETMILEGVNG